MGPPPATATWRLRRRGNAQQANTLVPAAACPTTIRGPVVRRARPVTHPPMEPPPAMAGFAVSHVRPARRYARGRASTPPPIATTDARPASTCAETFVRRWRTSRRADRRARRVRYRPGRPRRAVTAPRATSPAPPDITSAGHAAPSTRTRPPAGWLARRVPPIPTAPPSASAATAAWFARPAITSVAPSA
jgi:hypothetical protein